MENSSEDLSKKAQSKAKSQKMYSKIDVVINESAQFLSQYMRDIGDYRERDAAATRFVGAATDVKAPSPVYRPFSDFDPM